VTSLSRSGFVTFAALCRKYLLSGTPLSGALTESRKKETKKKSLVFIFSVNRQSDNAGNYPRDLDHGMFLLTRTLPFSQA
jgi:hypothetical protein